MKLSACLPFIMEPLENAVDGKQLCGWTLLQVNLPFKAIGFKNLMIPHQGTSGEIEGKIISWETGTSLWDVTVGEMELFLPQVFLFLMTIIN